MTLLIENENQFSNKLMCLQKGTLTHSIYRLFSFPVRQLRILYTIYQGNRGMFETDLDAISARMTVVQRFPFNDSRVQGSLPAEKNGNLHCVIINLLMHFKFEYTLDIEKPSRL